MVRTQTGLGFDAHARLLPLGHRVHGGPLRQDVVVRCCVLHGRGRALDVLEESMQYLVPLEALHTFSEFDVRATAKDAAADNTFCCWRRRP